jgi:hypothetical protein
MRTHSIKAHARHPNGPRQKHQVGHVTFEMSSARKNDYPTFALFAGEAFNAADRKRALFTGIVTRQMADELRKLADVVDDFWDTSP